MRQPPFTGSRFIFGKVALSLIQLLISITLIAILVSMSIGVFQSLSSRNRTILCLQNLRQLSQATFAYMQDHSMCFPEHTLAATTAVRMAWYIPLCDGNDPQASGRYGASYIKHPGYGRPLAPFFCPVNRATSGGAVGWTNYAINSSLAGKRAAILDGQKVLYIDSYRKGPPAATWYFSNGAKAHNGSGWNYTSPLHHNSLNAVFTDGHARTLKVAGGTIDPVTGDLGELEAHWFTLPSSL